MNYRHGFHAGNHTEVFKHSALVTLLELMRVKGKHLAVIDTHAGVGVHDLGSEMATRTREADFGIRKVATTDDPALRGYLDLVRATGGDAITHYPGSPEIVRRLLRSDDRLVACELHPEDAAALRSNMRGDRRVSVHHRDGYEAMLALVPPPERRGLVLIDPPFERPDEAEMLADRLERAVRKWGTGVFTAWFPIKDRAVEKELRTMVARNPIKNALIARFLALPYNGRRLCGGGILVINPPWGLDGKLAALCEALARSYEQADWTLDRIARDGSPVNERGRR